MSSKYCITAFNYYAGEHEKKVKETNYSIIALFYSIVYGFMYDGVDISKRD